MGAYWESFAFTPGLGIAVVSAVHAKVPVLLHDRSAAQVKSGLALMDKLLAKDVAKGKITQEAAREARDRVTIVEGLQNFRDVGMVVEVSCLLSKPRFSYIPRIESPNAVPQKWWTVRNRIELSIRLILWSNLCHHTFRRYVAR